MKINQENASQVNRNNDIKNSQKENTIKKSNKETTDENNNNVSKKTLGKIVRQLKKNYFILFYFSFFHFSLGI